MNKPSHAKQADENSRETPGNSRDVPDFTSLFHAAPAPYLVVTPQLIIAAVNDAATRSTATGLACS